MKRIIALAVIVGSFAITDLSSVWLVNTCFAATQTRNDGTYAATSQTVFVYTEYGHSKGSFTVYLHHGAKYIWFQSTWICIQGKSRFSHSGNWYVIK